MTKNILRCLLFFLLVLAAYQKAPIHAQEKQRVIEIHAKRFSFTPGEITLIKGEKVTLALTADDTIHGLSVPDLGVNVTLPKGKVIKVEVMPEQAGTFHGMCSHFCGAGHGSMVFSVLVKDN